MKRRQNREAEDKEVLAAFMDEMAARLRREAEADRTEHRPNLTVLKGGKATAIILGLLALPHRAREHWVAATAATAVAATAALGVTYVVTRPPEPPSIAAEEPNPEHVVPEVEAGTGSHPTTAAPTAIATTPSPLPPAGRSTPATAPSAEATTAPTVVDLAPTATGTASPARSPTAEAAPVTTEPTAGTDTATATPGPTDEPTPDPTTTDPPPGPGEEGPHPPISPPPGICVRLPGIHLCVVLPLWVPDSTVE